VFARALKIGLRRGWLLGIALAMVLLASRGDAGVIVNPEAGLESISAPADHAATSPDSPGIPEQPVHPDQLNGLPDYIHQGPSSSSTTSSGSTVASSSSAQAIGLAASSISPTLELLGRVYIAESAELPRPPAADLLRPPQA
jgi:hypothetical protein